MSTRRIVYAIHERTTPEGAKSFWTKIGVAFTNKDGSITCKMDALPISGTIQIRDEVDHKENKDPNPMPF